MVVIGNSPDGGRLAQKLKIPYIALEQITYPDGEVAVKVSETISDSDCLVYFQFSLEQSFDIQILNMVALLNYLAQQKASIRLVLPYLPYARSVPRRGELEVSKFEATVGSLSHFVNDLYVLQPHCEISDIVEWMPKARIHEIPAEQSLVNFLEEKLGDFVLTGPDAGSAEMIHQLADISKKSFVVLEKKRLTPEEVESHGARNPIDSKLLKKHFVIVDDISSTGGTLLATINQLREYGVKNISCFVFHNLVRDPKVLKAFRERKVKFFFSNSLPRDGFTVDIVGDVVAAVQVKTSARAMVR